MRWLALVAVAGVLRGGEADPAPATRTATESAGPSAGAVTIDSTLAADQAWALARRQAEQQAQARRMVAARNTAQGNDNRGAETPPEVLTPGSLATWAEIDEVALLIELQRRRNRAAGRTDLVAGELAASTRTTTRLPGTNATPPAGDAQVHPADEPHPGPRAPTNADAPDRPERFPTR